MKVGIYTPYSKTIGGGERYIATVAETLSLSGHEVDYFWDQPGIREELTFRFSLDLSKVRFVRNIFQNRSGLLDRWRVTGRYDAFFFVSDGSLPFLFAKKNFIHFQVPFTGSGGRLWLNRLKLSRVNQVFCNSRFTKSHIDREYHVNSIVIYPPVDVASIKPTKKKKIILSVGRLGESLNNKKQEVLVSGFKQLLKADSSGLLKGWRLVIVGGIRKGDEHYLEKLKKQADGYPIEFLVNQPFEKLKGLFGKSRIFWHAAGFGESEVKNPKRMEHFGMVVVEAMAAGCVPVVVGKGGIKEIVNHNRNGLLWQKEDQLVKMTLRLISSRDVEKKLAIKALKDSQKFSKEVFNEKIARLIEK